jgi:hypothetical protein
VSIQISLGQIGRRPPESTSIALFRQENGLSPEAVVPADAVTASGSGRRLKKQPAPDDFLTIIRRQQLGKLKIYLGPCPGVGKTYQMLIEGNRLRRQGVDVVIGYVEPHDRPETTAQIGDLEIVPPLVAKYHGITLKEMDLDAVLARKPTVALVDELAHTNAPQSRNRKRYEDVQDLLRAGINVIATVNIQHLTLADPCERPRDWRRSSTPNGMPSTCEHRVSLRRKSTRQFSGKSLIRWRLHRKWVASSFP